MEKIKKLRVIWLSVFIASISLGALAIAGIFVFSYKLMYVGIAISVLFVANAAYGSPFYFIKFRNTSLAEKIYASVYEAKLSDADGAESIGITPEFYAALKAKYVTPATDTETDQNNEEKAE